MMRRDLCTPSLRWLVGVLAASLAWPLSVARAQGSLPTDEQVDKLIADLQEALFTYQVDDWAVVTGVAKDGRWSGNHQGSPTMYKSVALTDKGYEATDKDGKKTTIAPASVYFIQPPGHFQPDHYGHGNPGGHTTMAMWALVASDYPRQEPRFQKAMKSYFEGTPPRGTYSLSFRQNMLSHIVRWWPDSRETANYKKVLEREAEVMFLAMSQRGDYGYGAFPPPGFELKDGKWVPISGAKKDDAKKDSGPSVWQIKRIVPPDKIDLVGPTGRPNGGQQSMIKFDAQTEFFRDGTKLEMPKGPGPQIGEFVTVERVNKDSDLAKRINLLTTPPAPPSDDSAGTWAGLAGRPANGSDNSNTQFGPFALSAAEDAGIEVSPLFWEKQDEWWQRCQVQPAGNWQYRLDSSIGADSDANMTDAGLNSLYLVVDKRYSRQTTGYSFPKGFRYQPAAYAKMQKTFAAINRGWAWIEKTKPTQGKDGLYHDYGMQRLGLSSGRKRIGGRPWYETVVEAAYQQGKLAPSKDGGGLRNTAWRIMCLAFGRKPVIFNKLAVNTPEEDWNYYVRDVANLTWWLGRTTENPLNWQIVSVKDSLFDMQDAPIMIVTSGKPLAMTDAEKAKIRKFLDFGGTIFLTPLQDSAEFKSSARKLFEDLYKDEGFEFKPLARNHPVYTGKYGDKEQAAGAMAKIPLLGMSDGARDFVILCDGDIAGAWHLRMWSSQEDLFKLMLNLRLYAAPNTAELPGRLRPKPQPLGSPANKVVVARVKHAGNSKANRALYEALAPSLAAAGIGVDLRDQAEATDAGLAGANLIHITGHNRFDFSASELAAIKAALANGAFLVLDPAAARPQFSLAAVEFIKKLGVAVNPIDTRSHRFFEGISVLRPNKEMVNIIRQPGLFNELTLDGKVVGFFSRVDITAAGTGVFVPDRAAIGVGPARALWTNLAKAAMAGKAGTASAPTPAEATSAPAPATEATPRPPVAAPDAADSGATSQPGGEATPTPAPEAASQPASGPAT